MNPKQTGAIDILRWDNQRTASPDFGGVRILNDHRARLVRGQTSGTVAELGKPFSLEEGCWNWLVVVQRLSSLPATDPHHAHSSVYVNGKKLVESDAPNSYGRGADDVHFGLRNVDEQAQARPLEFFVDNAFISNDSPPVPPAGTCTTYEFGPTVAQMGPQETVFDHSNPDGTRKDACEDLNIPDLPARAFRDSANRTQLILVHYTNYRMTGSSLDSLSVDCRAPVLTSHRETDPSSFNNWEWLASPYTPDGTTVYSLVYDEFHGWDDPSTYCPGAAQGQFVPQCWYGSLTLATSTNRGDSYTHASAPTHLVASIPFQYEVPSPAADRTKHQTGYFDPSNIIRTRRTGDSKSYYYAMIPAHYAPQDAPVQQWGACVMRTTKLADRTSWRAWGDGPDADSTSSFEVPFTNPYAYQYTANDPREKHVCEVVSRTSINNMSSSLTWNTYLNKYLLVGYGFTNAGAQTGNPWDIYYSTSDDLINWSPRQLLMNAEIIFESCGTSDPEPILYPTLIDQASTSRNFETTGQHPHLYFTRFNQATPQTCNGTAWPSSLDRDLIRIPIEFSR